MSETVEFSELQSELEERGDVSVFLAKYKNGELVTDQNPEQVEDDINGAVSGENLASYLEDIEKNSVEDTGTYEPLPSPENTQLPSERVEVVRTDGIISTQFDLVVEDGDYRFDSTGKGTVYNISVTAQ